MKITCSIEEFATLVRNCNMGACYNCAFESICVKNDVSEPTDEKKRIENAAEFFIVNKEEHDAEN